MRSSHLLAAVLSLAVLFGGNALHAQVEGDPTTAEAVCDYRPSYLLGGEAAAAIATGGTSTAAAGSGMVLAGFYTLTHSTSGLTMLGSTMAGSSAAGTIGIIGGSGGLVGAASAILMAPATIISAAAVSVVTIGFEGACLYLVDERITEFDQVLQIVEGLAQNADPNYFMLISASGDPEDSQVLIRNEDGRMDIFDVEHLFIVDGFLKYDSWTLNTTIGRVGFVPVEVEE